MGLMSELSIKIQEEEAMLEFENDIQLSLDIALTNGYLNIEEHEQTSIDLVNEDYHYLMQDDSVLGDLVRDRARAIYQESTRLEAIDHYRGD
jgi:hypothetical protein